MASFSIVLDQNQIHGGGCGRYLNTCTWTVRRISSLDMLVPCFTSQRPCWSRTVLWLHRSQVIIEARPSHRGCTSIRSGARTGNGRRSLNCVICRLTVDVALRPTDLRASNQILCEAGLGTHKSPRNPFRSLVRVASTSCDRVIHPPSFQLPHRPHPARAHRFMSGNHDREKGSLLR